MLSFWEVGQGMEGKKSFRCNTYHIVKTMVYIQYLMMVV